MMSMDMSNATTDYVDTETGEIVPHTNGASPAAPIGDWRSTALVLPEGLAFDAWLSLGLTLQRMERSVMWWIGDWWRYGDHAYGERAAQALDSGRFSFQTYMDAGWVAGKVETSRRREVLSWSHHKEIAAFAPHEQDEWLDRAEQEDWSRNTLRHEIKEAARQAIRDRHASAELPAGRYSILLADPPWRYDAPGGMTPHERDIESHHYPTMALDEICALPVPAADDAVLFLWATAPLLPEALAVVEAWGFQYRTNAVWVKDRIGMGFYVRGQHELLLICRRGDFPIPAEGNRPPSVIAARRSDHSAKPAEAHELIERMYPEYGPAHRLELFARSQRDGWTAWGNEL